MSKISTALLLLCLLMLSGSAFADQFYFSSPGTVTWDGVYVNPYQANDNTHPQNNPLTIYCDDWNTEFSGNPTWNADVYALTPGNVPNFKYGQIASDYSLSLSGGVLGDSVDSSVNVYDLYLEAAYLDQEMQTELASGDSTANKQLEQIEYSDAEWTLFVNSANVDGLVGAINSSGFAGDVYSDLVGARTAVAGGFNAAGWDVLVPVDNSFGMQEFLVSTPEPSAVILLVSIAGLLGFAKFRRKREA